MGPKGIGDVSLSIPAARALTVQRLMPLSILMPQRKRSGEHWFTGKGIDLQTW